jgi:hypothetical protein
MSGSKTSEKEREEEIRGDELFTGRYDTCDRTEREEK